MEPCCFSLPLMGSSLLGGHWPLRIQLPSLEFLDSVFEMSCFSLVFIYDEILSRGVCRFRCSGQFCWGAEKHRALVFAAHFFVAVFTNPSTLHGHGGCFFFSKPWFCKPFSLQLCFGRFQFIYNFLLFYWVILFFMLLVQF